MNDYVVWMHDVVEGGIGLQQMFNCDDNYKLSMGISMANEWPDDVYMEADKGHRKDTEPTDALFNVSRYIVVNDRLKTFLENAGIEDPEYLKIDIQMHDGTMLDIPYYVVNFATRYPCLDLEKSNADMSLMIETEVDSVQGIVLKDTEVLENVKMFRFANFSDPTLVSRNLAAKIDAEGFTGVRWAELSDFRSNTW